MRTRPSPLPPQILMLLLALGAYLLARATPAWHWANPAPIALGIVLALAGLACNVALATSWVDGVLAGLRLALGRPALDCPPSTGTRQQVEEAH